MATWERTPLTLQERERIYAEVLDEVFGLGPLEPLLKDQTISDILVNSYNEVYVERRGRLERTSVQFRDDAHLMAIITRIVSAVGRRVDETSPIVDARLADGSRANAIIPPLSIDGPCLSIRRFGQHLLEADDLVRNNTLTAAHDGISSSLCIRATEFGCLRRTGFRKDDTAQCAVIFHFQTGTHRHNRGCHRTSVPPGSRRAPGNTPAEHRRVRRDSPRDAW